jgi:hypothetical protein
MLGTTAKTMTEPLGTSPATPEPLSVTVVAVTLFTVVPGAILTPTTGIPALTPVVDAKVNPVVPLGQSAVVLAVTGAKVMIEPLGTSPGTPLLSVTVVAVTLCTAVPAAMPAPKTGIPALIPFVQPGPKVNVLPARQSAVVFAVTAGTGANAMIEPLGTSPATPAPLSVTVASVTLCTVVPAAIFPPMTAIPSVIPLIVPGPNVNVIPGGQSTVVVAVLGAIGEVGTLTKVTTDPLGRSAATAPLSVTVGAVGLCVMLCTVVPGAIFTPKTNISSLTPFAPPASRVNIAVP